jgi:hypothetical protein
VSESRFSFRNFVSLESGFEENDFWMKVFRIKNPQNCVLRLSTLGKSSRYIVQSLNQQTSRGTANMVLGDQHGSQSLPSPGLFHSRNDFIIINTLLKFAVLLGLPAGQ